MRRWLVAAIVFVVSATGAQSANLAQTIHFANASADSLFELYSTSQGHSEIIGVPAQFTDASGDAVERAIVGGGLDAFCFEPDACALKARILDMSSNDSAHVITMAWWNFGWVSAVDPANYSLADRGAPESILVLTFRDTLRGAQIELVQVNVPDYRVLIPSPDGSEEVGPLSAIVNTHWNTLYWDGIRRVVANP